MASLKMGQEESSVERMEVGEEENAKEPQPRKMMCPHCMTTIATYRCKIMMDDISEIETYDALAPFWDSQLRVQKEIYIVVYLGCEQCMTEQAKPHFAHIEDGWEDELFVEDNYEMAIMES